MGNPFSVSNYYCIVFDEFLLSQECCFLDFQLLFLNVFSIKENLEEWDGFNKKKYKERGIAHHKLKNGNAFRV